MTRRNVLRISAALPLARFASAFQGSGKRASPHETVSVELWRLGADEATKITVQGETLIGDIKLSPGSYSLFAIPGSEKWTIIVNKVADQWGRFQVRPVAGFGTL
jgi:Protein of unknown function (DUF2911)